MAKELLSVRIPSELMDKINGIAAETRRDKTSVTVELLQRGLDTVNAEPMESENYVSSERFESAMVTLTAKLDRQSEEIDALKKPVLAA